MQTAISGSIAAINLSINYLFIIKITLQNDPARAFTSTYQSANHILTFQSPLHRITSETLNTNAQLASLQVGSLIPAHFSYDSRGRLISVSRGDRHSSLNYDAASNIASSTDFLGRVTQFQYDQAGRVILEILPDGDRIAMTYDSNGNMISLTPPGKTAHSFSYNLFELVGQYLPPSLNATISGATTYSYNLDKQLTQVNRPDGKQISFNYGVTSGLLNSIVTAEGIFNTTYGMNSSLVKSISSPDHVVMSYQYAGSLPLSVETTGPVLSSIHYDYSSDGSVSAIGVAGKNNSVSRVDLKYDKDGLLTGAGDEALSLNDVGSVSATVLGKVRESVGFDNLGQITSDEFFVSARSILKTQLTRDSLERITRLQKIFGKASKDISYQYDVQGRLTEVREGSRIITTYKYDANGNRIEVIHQGRSVSAKYDVQDRLISFGNTDYIYNASGERLAKTVSFKGRKKAQSFTTNYAYDSFGNLKSATLPNKKVINYILDGQNRRIGKKVNGSLVQGFVYQSQTQVAAELDSSGQMIKQFIYGSKENIPDYMIYQGKEYRIISNHVGTPEAVVEVVSGKTIEQLDFDEFGVLRSLSGKNLLPFGFAGGLLDQDTKLTHFGAREYDAESGRWLQKDPIRFQGGDTNLMSYVANDPINGIDPSGLKTIFLITRGALGIGNHIAVYIDNGGSPMIFDPGGTYATPLDGTGDLVSGARANTGAFAAFHQSHFGDSTEMITFDTSSADEAAIADRLQGPGMGGFRGGQCATGVSSAVDGIGPFKGLGSNFFFPGSVGRSLRALGGR